MKRRQFLVASGVGAGALVGSALLGRKPSHAAFGDFPAGAEGVRLPSEFQAKRVLEIFLYGGLSPWETLYMVEEYGRPDDPTYPNQQFHTFNLDNALDNCAFPAQAPLGQEFAQDANGMTVKLGPFAHRLRQRNDLTDRMRVLCQFHRLEPHEAAVPQALTGKPVGQPAAAGLGTHIQRYFADHGDGSRTAPYSYVYAIGGVAGDNVSAAASTGHHPGVARPLLIKVDNAEQFYELLFRQSVGQQDDRARYDRLTDIYAQQFAERLRWRGEGDPVRSAKFAELNQAVSSVSNVDAITQVLEPSTFDARPGTACGAFRGFDIPGTSLEAARHLLTHPDQPARYVCVSDVGLYEASGGGGYDTHVRDSVDTAQNFDNLLRSLSAIVNQPDENDPSKLDLDDTLIILNTEFGRTPYRQEGGSGRNHHPYGYVTAFIGGPIGAGQRGIYGGIGPNGVSTQYITPAENRIAALLALGIWPFSQESFAVSDVQSVGTEENAARSVIQRVLGHSL